MSGTELNAPKQKRPLVLDTNAVIFFLTSEHIPPNLQRLPDEADLYVSVITRIELYAKPGITPEEIKKIVDFLSDVSVVPLNDPVEAVAIPLWRAHPAVKLPDADVAATAVVVGASLLTNDLRLLRLIFAGFTAQPIG